VGIEAAFHEQLDLATIAFPDWLGRPPVRQRRHGEPGVGYADPPFFVGQHAIGRIDALAFIAASRGNLAGFFQAML
jgi:hypothetical protein